MFTLAMLRALEVVKALRALQHTPPFTNITAVEFYENGNVKRIEL